MREVRYREVAHFFLYIPEIAVATAPLTLRQHSTASSVRATQTSKSAKRSSSQPRKNNVVRYLHLTTA